jgi:hypothetical protein
MKHSLTILQFSIFISLLITVHPTDQAGVRIAVTPNAIKFATSQVLPYLQQHFQTIIIPDTVTQVDTKLCTITISITEISLTFNKFSAANIAIAPIAPNKAEIKLSKIEGSGHFVTGLKCGVLPTDTTHVSFDLQRVDAVSTLDFNKAPSPNDPTKLMPSISLSNTTINTFDFDFDLSGIFIKAIAHIAKQHIKRYIVTMGMMVLQKNIHSISKKYLTDMILNQPIYFPVGDYLPQMFKDFAIDLSLTAGFRAVSRGLLEANFNGAIVNNAIPTTKMTRLPFSQAMPLTDPKGKDIQVLISEYFINRALSTLHQSSVLTYTVTSDLLPPSVPIKLNSDLFDAMFDGIIKRYGRGKDARVVVVTTKEPAISLSDSQTLIQTQISTSIQIAKNGSYEECISFLSDLVIYVEKFAITAGKVTVEIDSVTLSNSKLARTILDKPDVKPVESFLNMTIGMIVPVVNEQLLVDLNTNNLVFKNIDLTDTAVEVESGYISVGVNPKVKAMKKIAFLEEDLNEADTDDLALLWF